MSSPTTRCREYKEGWKGRKRTYKCRECGEKFQVDTLNALPLEDRICPPCKERTHVYTFIDKQTGKECEVRAVDPELATLRAKHFNYKLKFKV